MRKIEEIMKAMTFEYFGGGNHKIMASNHLSKENGLFLDVRYAEENTTLAFGKIQNMPVLHIPIEQIPERINEIPKDKSIGVFCSSGVRSSIVYVYLRSCGYKDVRILEGGYAGIVEELKPGKLFKRMKV